MRSPSEVNSQTMHADEVPIRRSLVLTLLQGQFPHWAQLHLEPLCSSGTDNAIFRLGQALLVRLPRTASAAEQVAKQHTWLPRLAPHLPLTIPSPVALGEPAAGFPWQWSVYRWIEGSNPNQVPLLPLRAAEVLASFILALQAQDAGYGPRPGSHNSFRGEPLSARDHDTRAAIAVLHDTVDSEKVTAAWEASVSTRPWDGPPVWVHGDLLPTNLLLADGRIIAVIDFGLLGVGDPACDLMVAWTCLDREARTRFRRLVCAEASTWLRARGWALSFALIALPYYATSNSELAGIASRTIHEVLAEVYQVDGDA